MLEISKEHADLFEAIKKMPEENPINDLSLAMRSVPSFRSKTYPPLEIRATVLHTVTRSLNIISSSTPSMQKNEAMVRLATAAHLAGIKNIQGLYKQSIPVKQYELERLEERAKEIKLYGSAAAFLWKRLKGSCKKEKDLTILLHDGTIDLEQKEMLRKIFKDKKRKNCLYKASFEEVDVISQAIFLDAAHLLSKKTIKAKGFIPWTESFEEMEPSEPSLKSLELESSSRGGFASANENVSIDKPCTMQFHHSVAYIHATGGVTISQMDQEGSRVHVTCEQDK